MPQTKLDVIITARDQASSKLKGLSNNMGGLTGATKAANKAMTALKFALAAGLVLAFKDGIEKAISFDKAMRNVDSIAKLSGGQLDNLSSQVRDLSMQEDILFQSSDTLAQGLYDVYSSGFEGKIAMDILEVSARGAGAGLTDTAISAKALMGIMNAYNRKTAPDATAIMDVLFKTVDKGVISFEELAQNVGGVVATASAAKVPIEVIGAAFATMTKKGIIAAEAGTALNQVLIRLMSPTTEMKAALKSLGYESGLTAIQTDGLQVVLKKLWDESDQAADTFIDLWGNVRAGKGALALASDGTVAFTEDLNTMANAAGSTQAAVERQGESTAAQFDNMSKKADNLKIEIATYLLPAAVNFMDTFAMGLRTLVQTELADLETAIRNNGEALDTLHEKYKSGQIDAATYREELVKLRDQHHEAAEAAGEQADKYQAILTTMTDIITLGASYAARKTVEWFKALSSSEKVGAPRGYDSLQGVGDVEDYNKYLDNLTNNAGGGPITAGSAHMVGEQGPELFVPNQSGNIVPNSKLGMGGVNVNIYGNINNERGFTPERIAQMIGREIELSMQGAR